MTGGRGFADVVLALPRTRAALAFAAEQHAGQRRAADGAPFIAHPIEVGSLLYEVGAADDVIAAGVLHDTIEKAHTDRAELRRRFGGRTTALVTAVSEDKRIRGYAKRKAALRQQVEAAGNDALMVFAADKVSKVRELPVERSGGEAETVSRTRQRKLTHYRHCLEMLECHIGDSPLVVQLRAELEKRTAIPRRRRVLAGAV
ncbi:MAG: bifunctional (p)ppGpp synthetase/guanosine-3',5'-bis(diphosphate) 3'-pyrophosphohydrolase [Solirubrobacterales bacterium]|nr:bifunctional (p)ppGpp synthetase/guanosine-3',5'-bis(diphosphate) 3'-pyrophosphohydrolase [Solirubrobacterales bacterium]